MAVSFDLFGTLVAVDRPSAPAEAVGRELAERGVPVPDDWTAAYREAHGDVPDGAEVPLPVHVAAALESRGVRPDEDVVRRAVVAAFDAAVRTRTGAREAIAAAAERGPVGVLSNCSVPGLVPRALERSDVDHDQLDAVVASVDCGWRKPDPRAFAALADRLEVPVESVVHVGDDPRTDGEIETVGGEALLLDEASLSEVPELLAEREARSTGGSECR